VETFGRHGSLAGILTLPTDSEAPGMPVVFLGAGIIHKVGPSRASVELARRLAEAGHPALRFDLSGIGDSPRVDETSLSRTALKDIEDAVSLVQDRCGHPAGVALVGFCSGADNALFAAGEDVRVSRLILFDPTVHATPGFERRRLGRRLLSPRSWWNVLSGRVFLRQLREREETGQSRPPGYYGLLTPSAEETDRRVAQLTQRDARLLYVLSSGSHDYCNAPGQLRESLPTGYSEAHISVLWAPEMDHILSTRTQRERLAESVLPLFRSSDAPEGRTRPARAEAGR